MPSVSPRICKPLGSVPRAFAAFAFACLLFGGTASAQTSGSSCNVTNELYFPRYGSYPDSNAYICNGSTILGLLSATASPLSIDFLGSVGIGTTAPGNNLEVVGGIRISGMPGGGHFDITGDTYNGGAGNAVDINGQLFSSASIRAPSFNTSTTGADMVLSSFKLQRGGSQEIQFGDTTTAFQFDTNAVDWGTSPLVTFINNGSEKFRITSTGNVGIGTTSPRTNLDLGTGFMEWGGQSRVASTFSATNNTTLAPISGLSATLTSGKTYAFDLILYMTSGSGGTQVTLNGGTVTASSVIGDAFSTTTTFIQAQTRYAALNTALCAGNQSGITNCHITGTITVNAGGTLIPQFAQNSSNATASTVAAGSIMIVQQIN